MITRWSLYPLVVEMYVTGRTMVGGVVTTSQMKLIEIFFPFFYAHMFYNDCVANCINVSEPSRYYILY